VPAGRPAMVIWLADCVLLLEEVEAGQMEVRTADGCGDGRFGG